MLYEKVLVPLDTSKLAERTLPYARAIGKAMGSQITLFTVGTPEMQPGQPLEGYLESKAAALREQGIKATAAVAAQGPAADQIIEFSDANGIDLIIASTHGRSGVGRWAVGDVARKVLQATAIPVLLVKSSAPEVYQVDFKKVLLPLDGSPFSEIAVTHAAGLAEATGAEIVALRVVEAPASVLSMPVDWVEGVPLTGADYEEKLLGRMQQEARQYLEKLRMGLQGKVSRVRWIIAEGRPSCAIANVAEDEKADLIVMGTHGRSGINRWIHGSVATSVTEDSQRPVLLVRPSLPQQGRS